MAARPQFSVTVITPPRPLPSRRVVALDLPGDGGRLTVLAHHQPLIASLKGGQVLVVNEHEQPETWTISPGTLSVERDGNAVLLVTSVDFGGSLL